MKAHLIKALKTALATSRTPSLKSGRIIFAALHRQSYFDSRREEQHLRFDLLVPDQSMCSAFGQCL